MQSVCCSMSSRITTCTSRVHVLYYVFLEPLTSARRHCVYFPESVHVLPRVIWRFGWTSRNTESRRHVYFVSIFTSFPCSSTCTSAGQNVYCIQQCTHTAYDRVRVLINKFVHFTFFQYQHLCVSGKKKNRLEQGWGQEGGPPGEGCREERQQR
jgi:hypothetical protein